VFSNLIHSQSVYENPLGFNVSFDDTWKRLPKEVLQQKMQDVKDYLEYRKDIHYEACYQKIGNADMDYPYILFKNFYTTTSDEAEMASLRDFFGNKEGFDKVITEIENGKINIDLEIGKSYFDRENRLLIFTYDMGISIKGNLVGLMGFYIGKSGSLQICCYSYKDEFKYDQEEFLEIIYSLKDEGMQTRMSDYVASHDEAVNYYNEGKKYSGYGNRNEAIRYYTLAINTYPIEDKYQKSEAYFNRGLNKRYLEDLHGAINDYTEAIKLRHDYYKAYNNRGFAKLMLEQYSNAIEDFTMTIKYDNYQTEYTNMALGNRGIAKLSIEQDGCDDLKRAIEEGNTRVETIYYEYCR
jgi:tetratricopeptide (TPR) repeat protein